MDPQGSEYINADQAYCSTQLINEDGILNETGLESFTDKVKLAECGNSYVVVSIMGPQSSGKSTLMNRLFETKFAEMNSLEPGRTTQGIWIANCVGIKPCTLVMDIEGTDGSEKGQDDTVFERQSALFALAVSDIVMINLWWHDVNREHAGNKPLLKTVFQIMLQILPPHKKTLLVVIRDTTLRTPLVTIESRVKASIEKIWDSVPKPKERKEISLSDVFRVEVVALSNFELEEEKFMEQVADLRQRFFRSIELGGLAGDRRDAVHASDFSINANQIWTKIKANEDLNLPAHKEMFATVRCEQIAKQKISSFNANMEWRELENEVKSHPVTDFGAKIGSILDIYLSQYDAKTTYYEDSVRSAKRKELEEKLLQLVQPSYHSLLEHIRSETLDEFKKALKCALNDRKERVEEAVHNCNSTCMKSFDKRCADVKPKQANWDNCSIRIRLDNERKEAAAQLVNAYQTKQKIVAVSQLIGTVLGIAVPGVMGGLAAAGIGVGILILLPVQAGILMGFVGFQLYRAWRPHNLERGEGSGQACSSTKDAEEEVANTEEEKLVSMKKKLVSISKD